MALTEKLTSIADAIRGKTGGTDKLSLEGMATAIAGIETGGGGAFEVTEGTITPATASQTMRIPWEKDTLPRFYLVTRQDFDTYVTPDNPATGTVLGGIVCIAYGYTRASASNTTQYINIRITATTGYTGYTAGQADFSYEILTSDGLLAYCNTASYKWQPDTTYKYYIFDKVVE